MVIIAHIGWLTPFYCMNSFRTFFLQPSFQQLKSLIIFEYVSICYSDASLINVKIIGGWIRTKCVFIRHMHRIWVEVMNENMTRLLICKNIASNILVTLVHRFEVRLQNMI